MRKVLILTYYWPPAGGAGVQRWLKFVKYLRDFGWEPLVYTVENGEMPVLDESLIKDIPKGVTVLKKPIWEPYQLYKWFIGRKKDDRINASFLNENKKTGLAEKVSVWIRGNFFIPDARLFWIRPSKRFLSAYLQQNPVDCIISSGPPHSMHLIALGLRRRFPNLKWIADFRDPWTNIDFYDKLMLSPFADRLHKKMERAVLREADAVLSIGKTMNEDFMALYQASGGKDLHKFKVISNGFDSEDLPAQSPEKDQKFSLAHIGTLVKDRNPEVLWKVLRKLIGEHDDFKNKLEIKLVGKCDYAVKEQINYYGLSGYVKQVEYLPHNEVVIEQQKSRVLLLLVNQTKNAKGILTGKFFEYMASGSPILCIGPDDGDIADILLKTGSGLISDFSDENGLEKNLLDLFNGTVLKPDHARIDAYSRKSLTRELSELLRQVCSAGSGAEFK
ncbi:MAG TPA: glycosyl transferase family 1 [Bacteroidia bacterium]|nr:glycosyl transferase family 1 [Bacteroidia bacterium]